MTDPEQRIQALERELATLQGKLKLSSAADDVIEVAIRDRLPLPRALDNLFPLLKQYVGATAAFVHTIDEDLEEKDFIWSADGEDSFPMSPAELTSGSAPYHVAGDGWTAIGQDLDVAGQDFGNVGIVVKDALSGEKREILADWLDAWCEQLDDFLASIASARLMHAITLELSDALKDQVLDSGVNRAIEILHEHIHFDDMVIVFLHSQEQSDAPLSYRVLKQGKMLHDSGAERDPEIDAFISKHANDVMRGDFEPLVHRFDIKDFREEVLITGIKNQQIVGRLVATSPTGAFNTFDRELLERFADYLRQRIVDFNREWKHLALCFPNELVQRLLREDNYLERLQPTDCQAAILYTDIAGFTRISEQILKEPRLIGKLINSWSERVVEILWNSGGVFDKMVGDCIIGIWGPPFFDLEPAEACRRAAKAALEIREFTNSMADGGEFPELVGIDPPIGVATGINYCPVMVGLFGPNEDYTAFSSGMNNAARLQGVAERDEILCMDSLVDVIGDSARFGDERLAQVKNVAEPLKLRPLEGIED